jgi:membrane-associated protease RseP (regulator of RpoE activity)
MFRGFGVNPMKYFLRLVSATVATGVVALAPASFAAESGGQLWALLSDSPALLINSSSGYLGIAFRDVDSERVAALKLKDSSGAEIITVDHDAPAGAVGLKLHDVILQMNGQPVAGAEQLRRMLHEIPPGRSISLVISRDGQQQTINVALADHAALEQKALTNLSVVPDPDDDGSGYALQPPASHSSWASGFFGSLTFGSTSVGVQLDTLGSQLADYFGVKDGQGLLVKHVAANSPASSAGLKAGDVVTKVNGQTMATLNEWAKAIHANRGKEVQVTIFRNRKELNLTMQAGEGKHKDKGQLNSPGVLLDEGSEGNGDLAELDISELVDPQQLRDAMEQSSQAMADVDVRKLAEAARQIDTQKLEQEMQRSLHGIDMQKLQEQMDEQSKQMQRQMDEIKKEIQSLQAQEMY